MGSWILQGVSIGLSIERFDIVDDTPWSVASGEFGRLQR